MGEWGITCGDHCDRAICAMGECWCWCPPGPPGGQGERGASGGVLVAGEKRVAMGVFMGVEGVTFGDDCGSI